MRSISLAFALALSAAPGLAQSVTYYGPSTTPNDITVTGTPRIGTTIVVSTLALTGNASPTGSFETSGMLILGLDQIAVPFSQGYLSPGLPAPTSTLLTTPGTVLPMPLTSQTATNWTYQNQVSFAIPNDPGLIGFSCSAQWLLHTFANWVNNFPNNHDYWYGTNAARIVIG